MKVRILMTTLVLLVAANATVLAQCKEFKWPEDRKRADECVAIWGDAMKQGTYRSGVSAFQWMLTAAPQWNTKLYIDGATLYDKLADAETDPGKKKVLVDSLLMLYDLRIKNCGDEVNVLNRKALAMFKYNQKIKEKLPEVLALYDKVYEMSGTNVSDNNLNAYMTVIKNYQTLYKNLTDDQILQRYDKIMDALDAKLKKATETNNQTDITRLNLTKEKIDADLLSLVKVDCNFVRKNLAPKFKQNPNDLNLAKKIFKYMLNGKCTDDPLWLEAGEVVHKLSPEKDFGLLKALAVTNMQNGNYDRAEVLLKEALGMKLSSAEKADAQLYLGAIESKKKNFAGARELFRQAGTANPANKEPWEKIGDLYFNSADECAKLKSKAEDRLVYIAAYEMYVKAGNTAAMARAKAQFPSKEEIFEISWERGSTQRVSCWIGESVVLQTRD